MTEPKKPVALETREGAADGRRFSPSAERNRGMIAETLAHVGLAHGRVLEIASGTGEHGAYMTATFPKLDWTYTDIDPDSKQSQAAWVSHVGHDRLHGPFNLDASVDYWDEAEDAGPYDILYNANMIHISPFRVAEGLFTGAGRVLKPGGHLFLYGPFARDGEIAPSNAAFSENLKSRDPEWGVRDLEREIMPLAEAAGLKRVHVIEMPANNLSVVFVRT